LADVPANVVGYACGLLLSFHLNKNWTFDRRDRKRRATVIPFVCAFAMAYATNLGALLLFLHIGVNSYVAQALSMPVYTGVFYLLCAYFVFRPKTGGT